MTAWGPTTGGVKSCYYGFPTHDINVRWIRNDFVQHQVFIVALAAQVVAFFPFEDDVFSRFEFSLVGLIDIGCGWNVVGQFRSAGLPLTLVVSAHQQVVTVGKTFKEFCKVYYQFFGIFRVSYAKRFRTLEKIFRQALLTQWAVRFFVEDLPLHRVVHFHVVPGIAVELGVETDVAICPVDLDDHAGLVEFGVGPTR